MKYPTNSDLNGHVVNGFNGETNGTNGVNGHAEPKFETPLPEPIAIVGMALRLPAGIHTPEAFWELLVNGKDTRCEVPASRYNIDGFYSPSKKIGSIGLRHGHFLNESDSLEYLDTSFFTMSKNEVERLDPQQRMILEVVWECMENAGQTNWRGGNVGCFVGTWGDDWLDLTAKDTQRAGVFNITGAGDFSISNRVSYEYSLKGPSMTIKAACSSAMVGLHEACQSILAGDCESAIVAGTNLIVTPTMTIAQTEAGVLSPTGECRTFDATANGYSRGEAINAIFVKKLADAVRDNDPIRAVIRSTATNHNGRSNGITTPLPEGHERLIQRAYKVGHIRDLSETGYVECHGTGTQTGDPLEVSAVAKCFTSEKGIYIGSVKANVGHSEGASGVTSVIKAVMALENRTIPPQPNFKTPNPRIPFEQAKLRVPLKATPWPTNKLERVSVNSFGITGANAHAIIESPAMYGIQKKERLSSHTATPRPRLLTISATNDESLKKNAAEIKQYLEEHPTKLESLAFTLSTRRERLQRRAFVVTDGQGSFELNNADKVKQTPKLTFVFTGQGAQWPAMGKELMQDFPTFKSDIHVMNKILGLLPNPPSWDLEEELLKTGVKSRLEQAEFAQPLCTAVQVALVNLLRTLGVSPAGVAGHSSGEIAAAYAAGAITSDEAIIIAYYRGLVTKGCTKRGAMAAVGLGRAEATLYLEPGVVVACENSPASITLSGDEDALDATIDAMKHDDPNVFIRKLKTGGMAYHSHHMHEVGEAYEALLTPHVRSSTPNVPFFSSVTGKKISTADFGPAYWRSNLENTVRFFTAIKASMDSINSDQLFLEIGPHSALAGPLRQIFKSVVTKNTLTYTPTIVRGKDCTESFLTTAGTLYGATIPCNLAPLTPGGQVLTDLPIYSWRHDTSYWAESRICREWRFRKFKHHEILGSRVLEGDDLEPTWRNILRLKDASWLADHKVLDDVVFPCAGYVAAAGEAIRQLTGSDDFSLRNLVIKTGMVLNDNQDAEIITNFRPVRLTASLDSTWYDFTISSHNGTNWIRHCVGQARAGRDVQGSEQSDSKVIESLPRKVANPYAAAKRIGLNYGSTFQGVRNVSALPGKYTTTADLITPEPSEFHYTLHPTTIDHALQLIAFASSDGIPRYLNRLVVPTNIESIYVRPVPSKSQMKAEGVASGRASTGAIKGNTTVTVDDQVIMSLTGGRFSPLEDATGLADSDTVAAARLAWRPDVDFCKIEDLMVSHTKDPLAIKEVEIFGLLVCLEIRDRLTDVKEYVAEHFYKMDKWINAHCDEAAAGENKLIGAELGKELAAMPRDARVAQIERMREELKTAEFAAAAELIARLLDGAVGMFDGTKEALEIYLRDSGLTNVYNLTADRINSHEFFVSAGHMNPTMKILEIGAGTGGTTLVALKALTALYGERMYERYTYTDISSGFFGKAQERFAEYPGLEYKVLDISKDPIAQGFEPGTYDLVIASNVIHATAVLKETLTNVRKIMHPRGRFFLQELSPSSAKIINIVMGVLPGWWLGEADGRPMEPIVDVPRWEKELTSAGFAGVEALVHDDPRVGSHIGVNMIIRPQQPVKEFQAVTLLHREDQAHSPHLEQLEQVLQAKDFFVDRCVLGDLPPMSQDVISLLEIDAPFTDKISEKDFEAFKNILANIGNDRMLWVTKSAQIEPEDPRFSLTLGLSRSIRNELSIPFATLEIDTFDTNTCEAIIKVLDKVQDTSAEVQPDYEFILKDGVINIGRYHWVDTKEELSNNAPTEHRPLKLQVGRPGLLTSLGWVPYTLPEVGPDDVIIDPRCVGMNFRDVLVTMGLVEENGVGLGLEGSGVISAVGSNVDRLKVGDRVMMMGQNCFSTHNVTQADKCVKIPESLSFEEAATMPCVYSTVIHSLIYMASLRKGQSILIQSACGGVGISAIQIAQMIGAEIFCTVGNDEKVQYLMKTFNIPRNRIFHSRDASFLPDVLRETNGRGVDVALNSLSGELLHATWKSVAIRGKMVEIGKRDFIGRAQLDMDLFEANRSFIGVDLATLPDHYLELQTEVIKLYEQGHIKPIQPINTFDGVKVEEAFRFMQKGAHIGKIVVTIPEDAGSLPVTPVGEKLELRSDAAYIMSGGLGGLGKAVSTWMVENGARHLVYLSRSAGKTEEDQRFFTELESQDCTVQAIPTDVTKLDQVEQAINSITMPVAGVLQMAMVLRDCQILKMPYEDWTGAVNPKVDGTWNLHKALGDTNLDFFVMFGSISGSFGIAHQSNYAAGNSFQDAFVQYRHKLGLPASIMNIGAVDDIGYVSENQVVQDSLRTAGMHFLSEKDLLEALHLSILKSAPTAAERGPAGFIETSQLGIGIRATKPMSEPSNRVIWKRDKRVDIYRNLEASAAAANNAAGGDDAFNQFMTDIETDKSLLEQKEKIDFLTHEIGVVIYRFMLQPVEELDITKSLTTLGVDSLVTIEVRNWLRRRMGIEISTLEILNGGTIESLGLIAVERLKEKYAAKA